MMFACPAVPVRPVLKTAKSVQLVEPVVYVDGNSPKPVVPLLPRVSLQSFLMRLRLRFRFFFFHFFMVGEGEPACLGPDAKAASDCSIGGGMIALASPEGSWRP